MLETFKLLIQDGAFLKGSIFTALMLLVLFVRELWPEWVAGMSLGEIKFILGFGLFSMSLGVFRVLMGGAKKCEIEEGAPDADKT